MRVLAQTSAGPVSWTVVLVALAGCSPGAGGTGGGIGRDDNDNESINDNSGGSDGRLDEARWLAGLGIAVEMDGRTAVRVYLVDETAGLQPLTAPLDEVDTGARLIVNGEIVDDFVLTDSRSESATGALGPGQRLTAEAYSDAASIRRRLVLETADAHPGVILTRTFHTSDGRELEVDAIIEHDFELQAVDPPIDGPTFWSFQGGAEVWGEDYVKALEDGQSRENDQNENGGIPYCDVWSRGGGLGIGSASTVPRRLKLPVRAADGNTWMAIEWPARTLPADVEVEVGSALLVAHHGDVFPGAQAYTRAMIALGVAMPEDFPESAYLQHWETYGYEESWTVDDILWRLDELVAFGIGVVTIDSGWYEDFSTGDYVPDPALFPNGDADMRALTDAIHDAGLKAKLWWQPGNVERDSDLAGEHANWLVRKEGEDEPPFAPDPAGNPNDYGQAEGEELTDYMLCPAVDEVIDFHREFARLAIEVWGFDGFKMDYIYGVTPCDAEDHGHDSPDASVEAYPEVFRAIAETAHELLPDPVLNVCNCGVTQSFYVYPYENQLITSDPIGSRQMRVRTKVQKAFFGPTAPVLCDHIELSLLINADEDERDGPPDFASCLGVGAVLETKYTELDTAALWDLYWARLSLSKELGLSSGEYLGSLYTYGFDEPEAHVIRKGNVYYYGFFIEPWGAAYDGPIELRGLDSGKYRVENYIEGTSMGEVAGPSTTLEVRFENSLLIRATPVE